MSYLLARLSHAMLVALACTVSACDRSFTAPDTDHAVAATTRTVRTPDDAGDGRTAPPSDRLSMGRLLRTQPDFPAFCATLPRVSTRFAAAIGCDVLAHAPTLVSDEDDEILAAIAAEGDALLWEVDNAWNGGGALRLPAEELPSTLIFPPEFCDVLHGARLTSATGEVARRGATLGDAIARRNVMLAQGALSSLGTAVPPAVEIITTYVRCKDWLDGWGWGRNTTLPAP
ncbi:MAG: hypothetical protein MUF00_02020 [Gemmatimonadaceae bacterium]|jgi:hypothetical protein|nr:hypothetical protein [Gemmatimonadaceae bacterium]